MYKDTKIQKYMNTSSHVFDMLREGSQFMKGRMMTVYIRISCCANEQQRHSDSITTSWIDLIDMILGPIKRL